MRTPDFILQDHGSIWLCIPQSRRAERHLRRNTGPESQWWGGGLAVEPRFVESLATSIQDDGYTIGG